MQEATKFSKNLLQHFQIIYLFGLNWIDSGATVGGASVGGASVASCVLDFKSSDKRLCQASWNVNFPSQEVGFHLFHVKNV